MTSRTAGALLVVGGFNLALEATRPRRTVIQELDGSLSWVMIPNQHHFDRFLKIPEDINSFGFRGGEWSREKRPGVERIAVLGSSMTYGSSVSLEKIYTTILEERLAADGVKSEVFNCAVQGYRFEQSVRNYERNVFQLSPDVVIVAFADQDVQPMDEYGVPPKGDLRPWLTRTEFYRRCQFDWKDWLKKRAPENPKPSWAKTNKAQEINEKLQSTPFAEDLLPLWVAAEARMLALYEQIRARGGKLVITVLPQPVQAMDPRFVGPEGVWSRFCAGKEGCAYVDVIDPLRQALAPFRDRLAKTNDPAEREKLVTNATNDPNHIYLGDVGGHFNEHGMRIIGDALAGGVERVLGR